MKAKELLELLSKVGPEAEIAFSMNSGCCGDYEYLEPYDTDISNYSTKTEKHEFVSIYFPSLPGYHSCIQVGGTVRDDKEYWEKFGKPERAHKGTVPVAHEDKKK